MQYEWNYSRASATAVYDDGVCVVDVRGLVTRDVPDQLRADLRSHADIVAHVFVVCWDRACIAVERTGIVSVADDLPPGDVLRAPMVNVVNEECVEFFQQLGADRMAVGVLRVTTLSLDAALAWARRRAMVAEWSADLRRHEQWHAPISVWQPSARSQDRRQSDRP